MALTLPQAVYGAGAGAAFSSSSSSAAILLPSTGDTISYADLSAATTALRRELISRKLVAAGEALAVAMALPNSPELVVAFLAVAGAGVAAAPLNPAYQQAEFEFYIQDLRSSIVFVPRGAVAANTPAVRAAHRFAAAVAELAWDQPTCRVHLDLEIPLPSLSSRQLSPDSSSLASSWRTAGDPKPDDVVLILHTSGTTSRPKVVPLTHRNLVTTMENIRQTYGLTPKDRTMLVLPLFHVHGLMCGLLAPLFSGGSVILPPRFSARDFWRDFIQHKANWYTAVPTIHQLLLRHPIPSPVPPIRFVRSCSSPLAPAVLHQLEAALGAPVLEAYAMTEAAHQMTSNPLPPAVHKPGTVGLPQGGVELRILDEGGHAVPAGAEGEICVRGANVMHGYLANDAANASGFHKDGFFRSGDQGHLDQDGYLTITGRIKELVNKAGEKISPIELDNLLARHPAVAEAVSFAIPDETYGQDVGVAVVLRPGCAASDDDIKSWVGKNLARFKVPRRVFFTDVMPKTATGKIQRRIVAEAMFKQDKAKL